MYSCIWISIIQYLHKGLLFHSFSTTLDKNFGPKSSPGDYEINQHTEFPKIEHREMYDDILTIVIRFMGGLLLHF